MAVSARIYSFPKIISSLGSGADLFGLCSSLHYLLLVFLQWSVFWEVPIAAMQDKLKWGRKKAVTIIGGGSALVSIILFSSVNAIKLVDIVDHFINNIGIIGGALLSIISVAWFKRSALKDFSRPCKPYLKPFNWVKSWGLHFNSHYLFNLINTLYDCF